MLTTPSPGLAKTTTTAEAGGTTINLARRFGLQDRHDDTPEQPRTLAKQNQVTPRLTNTHHNLRLYESPRRNNAARMRKPKTRYYKLTDSYLLFECLSWAQRGSGERNHWTVQSFAVICIRLNWMIQIKILICKSKGYYYLNYGVTTNSGSRNKNCAVKRRLTSACVVLLRLQIE